MSALEREGTDVFHTLRGKSFDKVEDLADGLTHFEQRNAFSTALKEMDDRMQPAGMKMVTHLRWGKSEALLAAYEL